MRDSEFLIDESSTGARIRIHPNARRFNVTFRVTFFSRSEHQGSTSAYEEGCRSEFRDRSVWSRRVFSNSIQPDTPGKPWRSELHAWQSSRGWRPSKSQVPVLLYYILTDGLRDNSSSRRKRPMRVSVKKT